MLRTKGLTDDDYKANQSHTLPVAATANYPRQLQVADARFLSASTSYPECACGVPERRGLLTSPCQGVPDLNCLGLFEAELREDAGILVAFLPRLCSSSSPHPHFVSLVPNITVQ